MAHHSSVLGIVRAHHGGILVESTVNVGTTFTLLFPAAMGEVDRRVATRAMRNGRVGLLVDDDRMVRNATKRIVEPTGFVVITAEDGQDALELVTRDSLHVDVLVSDVSMPRMGGVENADGPAPAGLPHGSPAVCRPVGSGNPPPAPTAGSMRHSRGSICR